MTGPEHYQHAETLLDMASDEEPGNDIEAYHLAAAQVHATLALVAATMEATRLPASWGWHKALGCEE